MAAKDTYGIKIFSIFNAIFLSAAALICILPFLNVLAVSFSSSSAVMAGSVKLWPVDFTLDSYKYVLERDAFWRSFLISLERVGIGAAINIFLTILLSYPLSKENSKFKWRTGYAWFFFITMLINGGLIPLYVMVNDLKLMNTIWALVLPSAVPIFNIVLMLNFFRQIPNELEEAAFMDGAGHFRILWQIYVPVSLPSIATISLFSIVWHWNSWFDGLIYMNRPENYPLQSYLQTIIINLKMGKVNANNWKNIAELSDRTIKCSQIIIATIPILLIYPYLQRYFVKGMVLGSVKG